MFEVHATPYVVSTITCNGSIGTCVNLTEYFSHAHISDPSDEGIVYVEFGRGRMRGTEPRRHPAPKVCRAGKTSAPAIVRNCFENQVTSVMHLRSPRGQYMANVKLFRNGRVQATGIRSEEDGRRVLAIVADEVRRIYAEGGKIVGNEAEVRPADFRISMINTNFRVNYHLRRATLQDLLTGEQYNMKSYFGGTYPAVKLAYYWNEKNPVQGICGCGESTVCKGKGRGKGRGDCKKVTVCVFATGSVLITGGNSFEQVEDAYTFITGVLARHVADLKKVDVSPDVISSDT